MNDLQQISEKIKEADAILIGASNGLSIAEGLHIFADNQAFEELFGDFRHKYGILHYTECRQETPAEIPEPVSW